jgi:hypothetical protein
VADSNFDIWRLQSQADIHGLIEAVKVGSPEIRKRAATALRALGATSAIPALQSILVAEKDSALRSILITTLDYLFQQEFDEDEDHSAEQENRAVRLIAQLNSDSPEQVIRAAQNLGDLKEKLAAESLVVVFHNRQLRADVRLAAAEALIKLESAPVEVTLLAALRSREGHIRRNAAAVLGQLYADWAVSPLIAALRDDHEIVRRTAYAALKRIATPEALKAIEPPKVAAPVITPPPAAPTKPLPTLPTQPKPPESTAVTNPITAPLTSSEVEAKQSQPAEPTPSPTAPAVERAVVDAPAQPQVTSTPEPVVALDKPLPFDEDDTQPTPPPILSDDVS